MRKGNPAREGAGGGAPGDGREKDTGAPGRPPLGVGIITHNRLATLQGCVAAVARYTDGPYVLVIADDGSSDGTVAWARDQGIPVVTGPRRGVAWNKNRALRFLVEHTGCDPLLLLEEDVWPIRTGWAEVWAAAGRRWQQVNYDFGFGQQDPQHWPSGSGTADDPYQSRLFGGQCTVTTRDGLAAVGYLNSRFRGYGWGHVEWTERYRKHYAPYWGLPAGTVPALNHGVHTVWAGETAFDAGERAANWEVIRQLRATHATNLYSDPWQDEEERELLEAEVDAGWLAYLAESSAAAPVPPSSLSTAAYTPTVLEALRPYVELAQARLSHPNGPDLAVFSDGGAPARTLLSLCSMVLNGYAPPRVWLIATAPWPPATRELLGKIAPWLTIVTWGSVLAQFAAVGGETLLALAEAHPALVPTLFPLTHPHAEWCRLDDDWLVLDGEDDALHAFLHADLVYLPGEERDEAFRAAWPQLRSVPRPLPTGRYRGGLCWLRRFADPVLVAAAVAQNPPGQTAPRFWADALLAMLYASRTTAPLAQERYLWPLGDEEAGADEQVDFDFTTQGGDVAAVHLPSYIPGVSEGDVRRLTETVLDRAQIRHHPVPLTTATAD